MTRSPGSAPMPSCSTAVGAGPAWRGMTAATWADGQTVQVERSEPRASHVGKLHPFHVER